MSPETRHIDLPSGVTLHTQWWEPDEETGTPWVLTHGLASNLHLWDGVAQRLAARGHRVVTVDQRGHGLSSKPDDGYDMATCADDLALLVESTGLQQPGVAGQSWGGNVVVELAHRHQDLASMICCVDGGFIDLKVRFPEWPDARVALTPPPLLGTPVERMQRWIDQNAADWPPEGRAGTMANFEVRPDGTIAPWLTIERHLMVLRGLWDHDPFVTFPHILTPTLIIAADDGNPEWTKQGPVDEALGLLPTGRAEWFRPAHHDVHAQKPDEVASLLHIAVTDPEFFPTPST